MSHSSSKIVQNEHFLKGELNQKRQPFQIPHLGVFIYAVYAVCVCHLSVPECGQRLIIFNHPIVKKGFFRPLILGCEPRFVKNCSKRAFLKGRIEPKEAALPNSTFGGLYICSICCVCVCHLSVPECGQRLIIFNHPILSM